MRHVIAVAAILSAIALSAPAASAAGTGKFCLKGPGNSEKCKYATMAACEKAKNAKKGEQTCAANATGTTGAGSMGAPAGSPPDSMKK